MAASTTGSKIRVGVFGLGSLILIVFALGWFPRVFEAVGLAKGFGGTTTDHPFIMGFIKLFLLGTLGEFIKYRIAMGHFNLDKVLQRAVVWGVWGLWFTLAFPAFDAAVEGLIEAGKWPAGLEWMGVESEKAGDVWVAFSKSLWINVLGMFALGMMVAHEYANHLISSGWRSWSFNRFADRAQPRFTLGFSPKTLFFWVPAHTFTYAMPGVWRVFIAALLAIVLGFFLSVGRRGK